MVPRVLPGDDPAPAAVVAVLAGERTQRGARPVAHPQRRGEPDEPAGLADAVVELPVLGADEALVVAAQPGQPLAAEHARGRRCRPARPSPPVWKPGDPTPSGEVIAAATARSKPVTPSASIRPPTLAAPGLLQQAHGGADVVAVQHPVAVDAHDDRRTPEAAMAAFSARGCEPVGFGTVRTRGSRGAEPRGDLVGAVAARAERQDHLDAARRSPARAPPPPPPRGDAPR